LRSVTSQFSLGTPNPSFNRPIASLLGHEFVDLDRGESSGF
jgi:hypothetical protein